MKQHEIKTVLDACERRRNERRSFLRVAGGAGVAVASAGFLAGCDGDTDFDQTPPTPTPTPPPAPTPTPSPTPTPMAGDGDYLNFALNLEYLEAQFYSYAVTGAGLPSDMLGGTGTQGEVTGGAQVNFSSPAIAAYAREIAQDERAHVAFLRSALGESARVAQPAIDISADGPFTAAARAAGLVGDDETFDVYGSDQNFLLGAFIFEDVGVTAYKGAAPLISDPDILESAAGILSAEAYHAGLVRTLLYRMGVQPNSNLIAATEAISDARDSVDGPTDIDQGVDEMGNSGNISANLTPTDENGIAFDRTPLQVHNVVYLTAEAAMMGGFFPNGTNGFFTESGANAA